jgi:nickel superoxide dismutase
MRTRAAHIIALATITVGYAFGHCQIPCGIYGDQARFDTMLEHTQTISKSLSEMVKLSENPTANANQLSRWISNKEKHAQDIQDIIGDYFLAQRIKSSQADYTRRLKLAHSIIVYAMKAKQSSDTASAELLAGAIEQFRIVYFGEKKEE